MIFFFKYRRYRIFIWNRIFNVQCRTDEGEWGKNPTFRRENVKSPNALSTNILIQKDYYSV